MVLHSLNAITCLLTFSFKISAFNQLNSSCHQQTVFKKKMGGVAARSLSCLMNRAKQGHAKVIQVRLQLIMTHPGSFLAGQHPFLLTAVVGRMTQSVLSGMLAVLLGTLFQCPFYRGYLGGCQERKRHVLTSWFLGGIEVSFKERLLCSKLESKPGNSELRTVFSPDLILPNICWITPKRQHTVLDIPSRFGGNILSLYYQHSVDCRTYMVSQAFLTGQEQGKGCFFPSRFPWIRVVLEQSLSGFAQGKSQLKS